MSRYTTEQYEAMARAAGYEVWWSKSSEMFCRSPDKADPQGVVTGVQWNPANDPADNYRLMVDAGIDLIHDEEMQLIGAGHDVIYATSEFLSYADNNKLDVVMTAVCDCAIKIGEGMK